MHARMLVVLVLLSTIIACGGAAPAAKSQPAAVAAVDPELAAALAAIDEGLAARPDDGALLHLRARLTVAAGAPRDALPYLVRLEATGWAIALVARHYEPLAGDPQYRAIAARLAARDPEVARSALAFELEDPELIPEGIAVDPQTGTFYVGSIRKRTIVAVSGIGAARRATTFVAPRRDGLGGVLGLKVDRARGVLWAASIASDGMEGYVAGDQSANAVYAFALADGALRRRIAFAPAEGGGPHLPNDLAVAADGTVYVTDSNAGSVHRIPPDRDVLEPVVPAHTLFYPNGIALAPTGTLYVAHATGIAIADLATGAVKRVEPAAGTSLGGIDGLTFHDGGFLAVQNGLGKARLVRIALDATGERATSLTVLENSERSFELPTTACVHDGALFTIANSQLDALTPNGLKPGRALSRPRIVRTPINDR